ncbi:hypothetical protein THIOM_005244 [Candidatus Thiomargarita nelsonii]|uniref:DUF7467 domain-containing protein n=1 Tax=Candidatus Thiomargarita nelsonii TaxID=1003181 RepID=A0A176RTS0_9GAMM|nr:hypothetical protein THIOM_005244 [Candidatus Thiomargarita nelsonii]
MFIDNVEQTKRIHVSCSKPIGPGAVFGMLEVVEAISKDNGNVCPVPDCLECKGGVTELTLRYDGDEAAVIVVVKDNEDTYFDGSVNAGDVFTFNGTRSDGKFQKNDIKVYNNGVLNTTIHVSCSKPIGPGLVFGDFMVTAARSKDNGNVCPFCDGYMGLPMISYNFSEPDIVEIYISDDLGLKNVEMNLRAFEIDLGALDLIGDEIFPGNSGFPVVIDNTFISGMKNALISVKIDPSLNTSFVVTATDICNNTPCESDSNPPKFMSVVVGDSDNDDVPDAQGIVTDDTGIFWLDFFNLNNIFIDYLNPENFVGATQVDFRVERDDPTSSGNFGAIAADQCNAFAFDFDI